MLIVYWLFQIVQEGKKEVQSFNRTSDKFSILCCFKHLPVLLFHRRRPRYPNSSGELEYPSKEGLTDGHFHNSSKMLVICNLRQDIISRISHTEPGNVKGFYKKLKEDFNNGTQTIFKKLEELGK